MMIMPYQWPRLLDAMVMPELANDPRFDSPRQRRKYKFELKAIIEKWMARIGSRQDILDILKQQRVPAAPVLTLDEAIAHPHSIGRGAIREFKDPLIGKFPIPGQPPLFSKWNYNDNLKAPLLGEHNYEILSNLCGLDKTEIAALEKDGIITADTMSQHSKSDV